MFLFCDVVGFAQCFVLFVFDCVEFCFVLFLFVCLGFLCVGLLSAWLGGWLAWLVVGGWVDAWVGGGSVYSLYFHRILCLDFFLCVVVDCAQYIFTCGCHCI